MNTGFNNAHTIHLEINAWAIIAIFRMIASALKRIAIKFFANKSKFGIVTAGAVALKVCNKTKGRVLNLYRDSPGR